MVRCQFVTGTTYTDHRVGRLTLHRCWLARDALPPLTRMCKQGHWRRLLDMRASAFLQISAGFLAACGNNAAPSNVSAERASLLIEIPSNAGSAARACSQTDTYFASTPLTDREGWYGKHLRVLGERPLCASSDATPEVYRLTWLPSFHPTVIVRIQRSSGDYHLTAKAESGAGGYEPGHLARDTSFTLREAEASEFAGLLSAARFWAMPTEPPPNGTIGSDGAQWVLEGLVRNRYHVVDRWSPEKNGPDAHYRRLAEWMLARSGLAARRLVREY